MLEFLSGVFIVLLSIFFLFISSDKKVILDEWNNDNVEMQKENWDKISEEETKNLKEFAKERKDKIEIEKKELVKSRNLENLEKAKAQLKILEERKKLKEATDLEQENIEKNRLLEEKTEELKKAENKLKKEQEFLRKLQEEKLSELEEENNKKLKEEKDKLLKKINAEKQLESKRIEEKIREYNRRKLEETLAEPSSIWEGETIKKEESVKDENKNYISWKKTWAKTKVFLYRDWKIETKFLYNSKSPIKETLNSIIKKEENKISSINLKKGTLYIPLNKNKDLIKIKNSLEKTAKFFPEVKKVIFK